MIFNFQVHVPLEIDHLLVFYPQTYNLTVKCIFWTIQSKVYHVKIVSFMETAYTATNTADWLSRWVRHSLGQSITQRVIIRWTNMNDTDANKGRHPEYPPAEWPMTLILSFFLLISTLIQSIFALTLCVTVGSFDLFTCLDMAWRSRSNLKQWQ